MTSAPLSFARARELRPLWLDVPLPVLGETIRIRRLAPTAKLAALKMLSTIQDEDGSTSDEDSWQAWITILSWSIVSESGESEWDCDEGRDWLAALEIDDMLGLQTGLLQISGLSKETRESEIEVAKKN